MSHSRSSRQGPPWPVHLWAGLLLAFSLSSAPAQQPPSEPVANLFAAAWHGDVESVRRLLDEGAPANASYASARLLHLAAEQGHDKLVGLLLERGADVDAVDYLGDTALGWAAANGYDAVVQLLLAHHAVIDHEDVDGSTPLNSAIAYEHLATARLLIEAGADVKHTDLEGNSILMSAIRTGDLGMMKLLLEHGADPLAAANSRRNPGQTNSPNAITTAAGWGRADALELFLARVKPGRARDDLLSRALHIAASGGRFEAVRFLVEHTEVDIQRSDDESPGGVSRVLSEEKMDAYTPLSRAVGAGHDEIARYLVAKGARIEGRTNMAESILVCVVKRGNDELAQLFLDHKAAADAPNADGQTALMVAADAGDLKMTRLLLERGASAQRFDSGGCGALHYAAQAGHMEIVKALLDAGAPPATRDSSGKTAREYADAKGFREVAELLGAEEKKSPPKPVAK